MMRLRIRGPNGQSTMKLSPDATVKDLVNQIRKDQGISKPEVKIGYPPQPFALLDFPENWLLTDTGVKLDNEQLTISDAEPPPAPLPEPVKTPAGQTPPAKDPVPRSAGAAPKAKNNDYEMEPPEIPLASHHGTLVLRIMPDDNSCMFRAFGFAFFGPDFDNMVEMRSVVAQTIQANPIDYNSAVLDKEPNVYCANIQNPDQWGGAIELGILAEHFSIEVCAMDVENDVVYHFNQKPNVTKRCVVVYSGIHYDTVVLNRSSPPYRSANGPPEEDLKLFDSSDDGVLEGARRLCAVLRSRGYYTNTQTFDVMCNQCGSKMKGEKEATEHAMRTGHYDMGEVQ